MVNSETLRRLLIASLAAVRWELEAGTYCLEHDTSFWEASGFTFTDDDAERRRLFVAGKEALVDQIVTALRSLPFNATVFDTGRYTVLLAEAIDSVQFELDTKTLADDLLIAIDGCYGEGGREKNERRIAEYEGLIAQIHHVTGHGERLHA